MVLSLVQDPDTGMGDITPFQRGGARASAPTLSHNQEGQCCGLHSPHPVYPPPWLCSAITPHPPAWALYKASFVGM